MRYANAVRSDASSSNAHTHTFVNIARSDRTRVIRRRF